MNARSVLEIINQNHIESEKDLKIWDRLTGSLWLLEKVPLSGNASPWNTLCPVEQLMTNRALTDLTLLDILQGTIGAISLIPGAHTPHERAVLMNVAFMEPVRVKSHSSVFSTLLPTEKIDEPFRWFEENGSLQKKVEIVKPYYEGDNPLKRKVVSTMLEPFLFYSDFCAPMYWSAHAKLTNTADLIRFVIHDEAVHGYYTGYEYQLGVVESTQERRNELKGHTYSLLYGLYEDEGQFTEGLYDPLSLTEGAKESLRYGANKVLTNLDYETLSPSDEANANPAILVALSPDADKNHSSFSGSGSSYVIGEIVDTEDDDWDFWPFSNEIEARPVYGPSPSPTP